MATGLILGKFLPPTRGHQYLVDFALNWVEDLTVIVGPLAAEPIPGVLRHQWMAEMFPRARVVHLTDENPQYPHEHTDFWRIWHDSIRKFIPQGPDYVFASEDYGFRLAEVLGGRFIPVDLNRELVPISGTAVREHPMAHWDHLPEVVRPYFVRKVCLIGPESTGKSVLARRLARHFQTVYVAEYARGYLTTKDNRVDTDDFEIIARGHRASEEALARQANRVLICDTDLITTLIWADVFDGNVPHWVRDEADRRRYDLYLVTDVDVPWVDDPQRFLPKDRETFRDRCIHELEIRSRPYQIINGDWDERFRLAVKAVEEVIQQ
jgi:NadR type nicotinamide-nucleotide adenylyltransferase